MHSIKFENHPCFNDDSRHLYARVHLPVAPKCNIQCRFCSRKFDCVNESRPGVTSRILTASQALEYFKILSMQLPMLAVAGIAGPGDPFANPEETIETMRLIRSYNPEILLCVASNGVNVDPYINELAELKVSHVTITVNALSAEKASEIYAYARYGKRCLTGIEAASLIVEKQTEAIRKLKEKNIVVKINTIVIPGVNDKEIPSIAARMKELGADILNCMPMFPSTGSAFQNIPEPSHELMEEIRAKASVFMPQMRHCARCRADAVGLLGHDMGIENMDKNFDTAVKADETLSVKKIFWAPPSAERQRVAVASREGWMINQHLGEAVELSIYELKNERYELLDRRKTPAPGAGIDRWKELAILIADCHTLLVNGIGSNPESVLRERGLNILVLEGLIDEALKSVAEGKVPFCMLKKKPFKCGAECKGNGTGCAG